MERYVGFFSVKSSVTRLKKHRLLRNDDYTTSVACCDTSLTVRHCCLSHYQDHPWTGEYTMEVP
jgi:hypothetical protein